MSEWVNELNDQNFEAEVLKSELPALVDFWAPWCGPCRMVGPMVEELAKEYAGKIKVGKLNVDDNINTAAQYGVRSIPTLILFKGGKVASQTVGAQPKAELVKFINQVIST
ncbi:MAG: thioredoxin [Deltaproteobacteria bacterium RBG_13_61_14]|nr:MAG: thioredoxin [Deltaproteobacteria bacterium RBG_13_61_14]